MKKWLFNPFVYIAGSKALLIGWSIMLLTAIVSIFSHTHFDGVIDLHTARTATPVYLYFMEQLIDWGFVVVLCYIASLIFSRSSVRLVDIAGTVALSRAPMLLVSFIGFGMVPPVSDSVKVMVLPFDYLLHLDDSISVQRLYSSYQYQRWKRNYCVHYNAADS
jgi:hypothetical protein